MLLRDLVIVFGALTYKRLFGPLHGDPTIASKFNTFCADRVLPRGRGARRRIGWPAERGGHRARRAGVVTTAVSGIDYMLIYSRRAGRRRARARAARDGLSG